MNHTLTLDQQFELFVAELTFDDPNEIELHITASSVEGFYYEV